MKYLQWVIIALLLLTIGLIGAGQVGLLSGQTPVVLGVHDGRLAAPSKASNSVTSQADLYSGHPQQDHARIAPLTFTGDGRAALARLSTLLRQMDGTRVVIERPDYLYVQFQTPWLHFIDDAEFWLDPVGGVIQLRSASRLGESDLGQNRKRIEEIRQRFSA